MTNSTNDNTVSNPSNDPAWKEYLSSLQDVLPPGFGSSLEASYATAKAMRDSYRAWCWKRIDEVAAARKALEAIPETTEEDIIEFDSRNDTSFLESEIERLQVADDSGISRWNTREELGDVEYGIIEEESTLEVIGDSHSREAGYFTQESQIDSGPSLCKVIEHTFSTKQDAQRFIDETRAQFHTKGDCSLEVIGTRIDKGKETPYVAIILESDLNWDHKKRIAKERDRHLRIALKRIAASKTRADLQNHISTCRRYSRDMQVLNTGKTVDGNRKVSTIGWDYKRFATAMNRIADRADELKFDGFRRYKIVEFKSDRTPTDGDMLEVGCLQGEFLGADAPDENASSLWEQFEGSWISKNESPAELTYHNPDYTFGPAALVVFDVTKYSRAA